MMGLGLNNCFQTLLHEVLEIHWLCNEKAAQEQEPEAPPPASSITQLFRYFFRGVGVFCFLKKGFCYIFFFLSLENL